MRAWEDKFHKWSFKISGTRGPQIPEYMRAVIKEKLKGVDLSDNENIGTKIHEAVKNVNSSPECEYVTTSDTKQILGVDVLNTEGKWYSIRRNTLVTGGGIWIGKF